VIARLFGEELTCAKGGTWLLERPEAGSLPAPVAYLPPPSSALHAAREGALQ
jgi:hypothetical protein